MPGTPQICSGLELEQLACSFFSSLSGHETHFGICEALGTFFFVLVEFVKNKQILLACHTALLVLQLFTRVICLGKNRCFMPPPTAGNKFSNHFVRLFYSMKL